MPSSGSNSAVVLEMAEEFLERYRQGQRPSLKEYIDRHPGLAAEIKEVFPAMAMMENIALAEESLLDKGQAGGAGALPLLEKLEKLGDYRIIREIGRGGMGVVYEAEQVSLGRHVALKVMPSRSTVDARQKLRFEREAKSAAKLHHTNIVPVFGVGEKDGLPYYVMQFIQGLGMNDVLEEVIRLQGKGSQTASGELPVVRSDVSAADVALSLLTGGFNSEGEGGEPGRAEKVMTADQVTGPGAEGPPSATDAAPGRGAAPGSLEGTLPPERGWRASAPKSSSRSGSSAVLPGHSDDSHRPGKRTYWQSVATIGAQVAGALDYAHHQGILHRDIKPSNLLLDARGTAWITDFGLAKADDQANLTNTGDLLGTLRYMPPEAFEGKSDRRSDVYALGLTLYELLAMRPAFGEKDQHRLIKQVTSAEVARLDTINPAIPRDLVTIVHKAIDRDPAHRYACAGDLAADLRRYLDDLPIQARRLSGMERCARWSRRNPVVAGLTAAIIIVTAIGFATTIIQMRSAQDNAADARQNANTARQHLDDKQLAYANLEKTRDDLRGTLYAARMNLIPVAWEAGNVRRVLDLLEQTKPGLGESDLRGFEWHYWNRLCHGEKRLLKLATRFFAPAFSGDGSRIADVGADRRGNKRHVWLKVWDTVTAAQRLETDLLVEDLNMNDGVLVEQNLARLSHDGSRVAALPMSLDLGAADRSLRVWDLNTGNVLAAFLVKRDDTFCSFAFSDRGDRVAVQDTTGGTVKLCSVGGGAQPLELDLKGGLAWHLSFSPDGKFLACLNWPAPNKDHKYKGEVWLWDSLTGRKLWSTPTGSGKGVVSISPNGALVAAVFLNEKSVQTMLLFDTQTGTEAGKLTFPESGRQLANTAFTPDGKQLAVFPFQFDLGDSDTVLNIWDTALGRKRDMVIAQRMGAQAGVFTGGQLWTAAADGTVYEWDVSAEDEPLAAVLKAPWRDGFPRKVNSDCTSLLMSTGSSWYGASATRDPNKAQDLPQIKVLDFAGKLLRTFEDHRLPIADFAVSRLGTGVVSLGLPSGKGEAREGELLFWQADSASLRLKIAVSYSKAVDNVLLDLSPDGRYVALVMRRVELKPSPNCFTSIRVFDVVTGKEVLATPEISTGTDFYSVRAHFASNGSLLAACLGQSGIKVWNLATGQEKWAVHKKDLLARVGAFDPSGAFFAATWGAEASGLSNRRDCRIYDAANGQELRAFQLSGDSLGNLKFSPDGKCFAVSEMFSGPNANQSVIRVFDTASWSEHAALRGHIGAIVALEFSPDSKRLAVAAKTNNSNKGTVKIWDPATGHELLSLSRVTTDLYFSNDGHRLVGFQSNKSLTQPLPKLWDARPVRN